MFVPGRSGYLFSDLIGFFFCLGVSRPVLFYPNISILMGLFSSLFLSGFSGYASSLLFWFDQNISILMGLFSSLLLFVFSCF